MTEFTVRRYRPADRDAVLDLHRTVPTETPEHVPDEQPSDLANVEEYYLDAGGEFLVGTVADEVVGTIAYGALSEWRTGGGQDAPDRRTEIRRCRVAPDRRREGYGTQLYDRLEDRARQTEVDRLVLDVGVENEPARRFFEAQDFEYVDDRTVEIEGNPLRLALYHKELTAPE